MALPEVGEVWGEQQLLSQIVFCTAGEEEGTPPSSTFLHPATQPHPPAAGSGKR